MFCTQKYTRIYIVVRKLRTAKYTLLLFSIPATNIINGRQEVVDVVFKCVFLDLVWMAHKHNEQ